jgi:hypothetical protein
VEQLMTARDTTARAALPNATQPIAETLGTLIGTDDPIVAQRLVSEIERLGRKAAVIASSFAHLRQRFMHDAPAAVLIYASLLRGAPLVAEGMVEFVARDGDYFALAAGLVEHRLRAASIASTSQGLHAPQLFDAAGGSRRALPARNQSSAHGDFGEFGAAARASRTPSASKRSSISLCACAKRFAA